MLTQFSERQRLTALDRFGVLRAHVEDTVSLAEIARQRKLPLRTLERWLRGYREHGLAALVRKPRSNRGQHQLPQELHDLIEGLALCRPPLSAAAVCRQAVEVAKVRDWPAPSYSTVFAIVRGLAPDLVTLAHQCTKVYADQFRPLSGQELQGVIEQQWLQLGLDAVLCEHADIGVVNAITRVTGGNFGMLERLFAHIERIVAINHLPAVTTEVVTLARERLVDRPL